MSGSALSATTGPSGLAIATADGRISLGTTRPAVVFRTGGRRHRWAPAAFEDGGDRVVARNDSGLVIEVGYRAVGDGDLQVTATLSNEGAGPLAIERLVVLATRSVVIGQDPRRWRTYRNGYQSWSGTSTIGTEDREPDVPSRFGRAAVTDARHRSPRGRGHVRSDSFSAVCEPVSGDALGMAFTTLGDVFGFVELDAPGGEVRDLTVWADFDGVVLGAGVSLPTVGVRLSAATAYGSSEASEASEASDGRSAGWHALGRATGAAGRAMAARGVGSPHPGGWCSWYFYFTKVTESDVEANLEVLAEDGRNGAEFGCEYVMVDDGHQREIGDWLSTSSSKFPSGMSTLADRIGARGFDAGIWWAPFLAASRSTVARDHPEWLVRNDRGRPVVGLVNPSWGLTNPIWVLDTTHPEVIAHLTAVAATIGGEWGYRVQKLDFLYAAALPGRRHDPSVTRAGALRRGLEAVRAGAGDDGFLIGCGCPLGPAVGLVDAMRIGADVTPFWSGVVDRTVGRRRHGLSTRNAIRNMLTRSFLDDSWWLNDPDCLMVRDEDTRLSLDEVRALCTAIGMTNGMVVLSDRLDLVPASRRAMVAQARDLTGGVVEVVDLFERELPELVVSRHADHVDVGLFNLTDEPRAGVVDLARLGISGDGDRTALTEVWTGREVPRRGTLVDVGTLAPRSARVVRVPHVAR